MFGTMVPPPRPPSEWDTAFKMLYGITPWVQLFYLQHFDRKSYVLPSGYTVCIVPAFFLYIIQVSFVEDVLSQVLSAAIYF